MVKIGDVVLVHDDTPRIRWKLEGVNKGADGLIRSADIRTANGKTNRPISRLYPLEVTASETTETTIDTTQTDGTEMSTSSSNSDEPASTSIRPVHDAARREREQVKQWTSLLRGPPEDVTNSD